MHIPVFTERFFGMFVQFSFPSPFVFQPVFHNFRLYFMLAGLLFDILRPPYKTLSSFGLIPIKRL